MSTALFGLSFVYLANGRFGYWLLCILVACLVRMGTAKPIGLND